MQPYKIAIAGIGGVGGYYGALLTNIYHNSTEVSISFVARGSHMQAIQQNGLLLEKDSGNITAHPHHITDDPATLGPLDLIIFCCKGYSLQALAASFASNITPDTILLPLLNGVVATETLQQLYPQAKTLYGCTYLVSKVVADGVVKMVGDLNQLLFGNPSISTAELERVEAILKATGANISLHQDIKEKIWEKFTFISPVATATSAFNNTIDVIMNDTEKKAVLTSLMNEVVLLSRSENIDLPHNILDINMGKVAKMPNGATSSMHNDFKNNKDTELEMLTGYVVAKALQHNVSIPTYTQQYELLKSRSLS